MRDGWKTGETFTYALRTTEEMSASQYQESSPPVFATPHLVGAVEAACARLLEPWLDPGEMTVGGRVELEHTAPTPLGWEVRAVARLEEGTGKRFVFAVECFDDRERIGTARHTRFVVDASRFMQAVEAKAAERDGGQ